MSRVSDEADTIAAISTPRGESAVALVRISGSQSPNILRKLFVAAGTRQELDVRSATFGRIVHDGEVLDEVLVTVFRAPSSYTGEDVVEISCHGGLLVTARVLEAVLNCGARHAEPGEFTRRAFVAGKMDLTKAEAVMDLITARTPLALRAANEQLAGRLGELFLKMRGDLLDALAHLEAWIDFPEENIDPESGAALLSRLDDIRDGARSLLSTADQGRILREGVRTVIVGKPNAGKSLLLNRLLGTDRAIVSPVAGTTRDTIEEAALLEGILFRITDTAGLRTTDDPVEREGVERSRRAIDQADVVLHVVDAAEMSDDMAFGNEILVVNKIDLHPDLCSLPPHAVAVSALTGSGFSSLIQCMLEKAGAGHLSAAPSHAAINARHKALLAEGLARLDAARELLVENAAPEITAMELRAALDAVGRIIGSVDIEDVLGTIFSTFCIGK